MKVQARKIVKITNANVMKNLIGEEIKEHLIMVEHLNDNAVISILTDIAKVIDEAIGKGNKVIFFGNGGSAADAQHLAAEFVGRFKLDRKPLPAISLTVNTSILTAVSNDYSFDEVFLRQIEALANEGDVSFAISTSGESKNVLLAQEKAKEMGLKTVAFTGVKQSSLSKMSEYSFNAPSQNTPRIQECHILAGHIICRIIESKLFKDA